MYLPILGVLCLVGGQLSGLEPILDLSTNSEMSANHFSFTDPDLVGQISDSLYSQAVKQLPIVCVDIFIYDESSKSYLLILRKMPPAQDIYWYPGGRLYKGESFFDCARRKCLEETGVSVKPDTLLGVYSTIFPDSAWGCQTHTINIAVVALFNQKDTANIINLNLLHSDYKWVPIDMPPDNEYLKLVYEHAYKSICL